MVKLHLVDFGGGDNSKVWSYYDIVVVIGEVNKTDIEADDGIKNVVEVVRINIIFFQDNQADIWGAAQAKREELGVQTSG